MVVGGPCVHHDLHHAKPATSQRQRARRFHAGAPSRASVHGGMDRYPALRTASIHCDGTCAGSTPRAAAWRRSRPASLTPGTWRKASSMVGAQAAQCMPSTTWVGFPGGLRRWHIRRRGRPTGRPKASTIPGSSSSMAVSVAANWPAGRAPGTRRSRIILALRPPIDMHQDERRGYPMLVRRFNQILGSSSCENASIATDGFTAVRTWPWKRPVAGRP